MESKHILSLMQTQLDHAVGECGRLTAQRDDLLAALKRLLNDETWEAEQVARAAIARAEGGK